MASSEREKDPFELELERVLGLSMDILDRLRQGALLSTVLSDISLLAATRGDDSLLELISLLTYGYERRKAMEAAGLAQRVSHQTMETWRALVAVADVRTPDFLTVLEQGPSFSDMRRTIVLTESVSNLEEADAQVSPSLPPPGHDPDAFEWGLKNQMFRDERRAVLYRVKSHLTEYVQRIWLESSREMDRVRLLGADYRIVITDLNSLPGYLGDMLVAAGDSLRSRNPQSWQLCALGCRNVVLALGRELWSSDEEQYTTLSGDLLDVGPNKEKNRLRAYLDLQQRKAGKKRRIARLIAEANRLAAHIYGRGSAGKGGVVTHDEAKKLLLDTYALARHLRALGAFELRKT